MHTPLIHALAAEIYIIGIVSLFTFVFPLFADEPDTIFAPITVLSILVLSVATMAYLFFFIPIREYLDGNKELAARFLLHTIGYFAVFTVLAGVASTILTRI
jgi:hypothetical protein